MAENVYKVIELIGTSTESWEKAAAAASTARAGRCGTCGWLKFWSWTCS